MPRFFFDRAYAHYYRDDLNGADFESAEAALSSVADTAMELATAFKAAGVSLVGQSFVVRDQTGAKVGEIELAEVVAGLHGRSVREGGE